MNCTEGQDIFNNFIMYHKYLAKDVLRWNYIDIFEIEIFLKNGDRVIYDDFSQTIIPIQNLEGENLWKFNFGRRLKKRISLSGLTHAEVANVVGVSRTLITDYTNGKYIPNAFVVSKIAKVLNCTVSDLIDI